MDEPPNELPQDRWFWVWLTIFGLLFGTAPFIYWQGYRWSGSICAVVGLGGLFMLIRDRLALPLSIALKVTAVVALLVLIGQVAGYDIINRQSYPPLGIVRILVLLACVGIATLVAIFASKIQQKGQLTTPIPVGLTLDSAEVDIAMNDPDPNPGFKCKLRLYWTNDGVETIHLGRPLWRGVAIQGNELMAHYQLRQFQNTEKPWGDETEETDVTPGRRCRVWIGLSPGLRENAPKLLDTGELGVLTIPVSTAHGSFDVCIRPRDRGLKQWNTHAYNEQRKCIVERFMGMDHGAKEAIRILSFGRVMSAQQITDHLRQANFPNADKIFDSLRDDIVPLVARYGNAGEFRINPALEKIVKEIVASDKKEFLAAASTLPTDQFAYRVRNEPGFEARYKAIAPKD